MNLFLLQLNNQRDLEIHESMIYVILYKIKRLKTIIY